MRSAFPRKWALPSALALVVATLAVLIAAGLARSHPGPPPSAAPLRLDRAWVRAGGEVHLRVVATGGPVAGYGLASTLERKVGNRWVPTHHLAFGLPPHSGPSFARFGDPGWAVPLIGFVGDRWWTLRIPGDAGPGLHRIAKEVDVGRGLRDFAVPLYIS